MRSLAKKGSCPQNHCGGLLLYDVWKLSGLNKSTLENRDAFVQNSAASHRPSVEMLESLGDISHLSHNKNGSIASQLCVWALCMTVAWSSVCLSGLVHPNSIRLGLRGLTSWHCSLLFQKPSACIFSVPFLAQTVLYMATSSFSEVTLYSVYGGPCPVPAEFLLSLNGPA